MERIKKYAYTLPFVHTCFVVGTLPSISLSPNRFSCPITRLVAVAKLQHHSNAAEAEEDETTTDPRPNGLGFVASETIGLQN
jgi:hypothetical protein